MPLPNSPDESIAPIAEFSFTLEVALRQIYECLTLPPGAGSGYPRGHAVIRLRIENVMVNPIDLELKKIEVSI